MNCKRKILLLSGALVFLVIACCSTTAAKKKDAKSATHERSFPLRTTKNINSIETCKKITF